MNIALVELSQSHEECLYSQVQFLTRSATVDLYLHPKHKAQETPYRKYSKSIFYIPSPSGLLKKLARAFSLATTLARYDKVIFNTASSSKLLRNTILLLRFCTVECIGVLHNVKKLESSFTQRLISAKIKKYYVLNDHLLRVIPRNKKICLQSFYPIYFPPFSNPLHKPGNEVWLVIPGSIDYQRRDYSRLIRALTKNPPPKDLKFVLLGKLNIAFEDGKTLLESISKNNLQHYFITFESFIPNEVFHGYIKNADFILPLLVLQNAYLKYKISGSFNLAFAYKKPMLCHNFFEPVPDIAKNAVFYDSNTLSEVIQSLSCKRTVPKALYTDPKWDFDLQRDRYLNFLNLGSAQT